MKIAITSDHGGYELKSWLIENFLDIAIEWVDLGTNSTKSVDYPDMAYKLAECIEKGEVDKAVAICGTGIGISMALNRSPEVRAAVCTDTTMARLTRIDNDANVLCLGARIIGEQTAKDCLYTFLTTNFEAGGRHERRVNKLKHKREVLT